MPLLKIAKGCLAQLRRSEERETFANVPSFRRKSESRRGSVRLPKRHHTSKTPLYSPLDIKGEGYAMHLKVSK